MSITRTAWIDDDGSGTTGTIINNAEKTILYNQIDNAVGSLRTITAALPGFSANNGGTWTVSVGEMAWAFNPSLSVMYLTLSVTTSTIGGAPTNLIMTIPAGRTCAAAAIGSSFLVHGATFYEIGIALSAASTTTVNLHRPGLGAFNAGACNGYFSIMLPLV